MVNGILALDDEGGIAKDGVMPWPHSKLDMNWFRENTQGGVVIMGSKTFYSKGMPKPLPNRYNVVLTSKPKQVEESGAHLGMNTNIRDCIDYCRYNIPMRKIWVIGGANVFEQSQILLDELYLTNIHGSYDCDTFVEINKDVFKRDSFETKIDTDISTSMTFEMWSKKISPQETDEDKSFLMMKYGSGYREKIIKEKLIKKENRKSLDDLEMRVYQDHLARLAGLL